MSGLSLARVFKAFGPNPVLKGVDLTVPEGSLTAILGESGSGKTTLLRIVAGFERVDRGSVSIASVVDDGSTFVPPARRRVGYVPQDGVLFPHLTVAKNVAFGLPRGSSVSALLELVDLAGLERRYPHELSGGQQQRVALARALAVEPSIVLLDEPFGALDANMRATVRADVARILSRAGATSVLVTHDQDEALSMADQVAVLRDGAIVQHGTPHELYANPADPSLAAFLGEANLLDGAVHGSAVSTFFGTLPLRSTLDDGPAVVLIRPEQISLRDDGLPGHVVGCEYYGHDAMLEVLLDGRRDTVLVRVKEAEMASVSGDVRVGATGPVTAWPPTGGGARD